MNEIYWITVLGNLRTAALIIFPMATGVTILCVCILFSTMSTYDTDEIDEIAKRKIKKIAIPPFHSPYPAKYPMLQLPYQEVLLLLDCPDNSQ